MAKLTRERVLELVKEADTVEEFGQLVLDEFTVDVCEGCDEAGLPDPVDDREP